METNLRALRALTLLVASVGSFMVLLDGSIIFVALPEIQKALETDMSTLQWTVDAYTLPFAALMLTSGTFGDRFGRKKVFLIGLVAFVLGSALCGFASSVETLIAGRVVQGVGAAAINTGSLSLLVSTFTDPPGRAKAIGIWTAVSGVSVALGPLVGGALINAFSWRPSSWSIYRSVYWQWRLVLLGCMSPATPQAEGSMLWVRSLPQVDLPR